MYFIVLFPLVLTLFIWLHKKVRHFYHLRWFSGAVLNLLFVLTGVFLVYQRQNRPYLENIREGSGFIVADITEPPEEKDRSTGVLLTARYYLDSLETYPTCGDFVAYFRSGDRSRSLRAGDRLILYNRLREITNSGNPWEFDYRGYMEMRGVRRTAFFEDSQWLKIDSSRGSALRLFAFRMRENLIDIYRQYNFSGNELAVASALTLGYREGLDEELRTSFASSGATHILAVSGLHVGIFFMVLHFTFMFIEKFPHGRIIKAVIIIGCIWFYALLTGLSPSVLRASAMFTFVCAGFAIKRETNIINTLAASAFFLLLSDPFMLFSVGFRLSYLAVFGIVIFYPRISSALSLKNRFALSLWSLISVSLSAQLGTFPLALYYFNQFPVYFMLTNLFAIPLAILIIYSGMALLILSPVGFGAGVVAWVCNFFIKTLNSAVAIVEQLPYSTFSNVNISPAGLILIYAAIVSGTLFIIEKRAVFLKAFLVVAIAGMFLNGMQKIMISHQKGYIIYNSPGTSLYHFIEGECSLLLGYGLDWSSPPDVSYTAGNVALKRGLGQPEPIPFDLPVEKRASGNFLPSFCRQENFVAFGDKSFYFAVDKELKDRVTTEKFPLDYLVLTGHTNISPSHFFSLFKPGKVIADSSVPFYTAGTIEQICLDKDIDFHFVSAHGAYTVWLR